MIFGGNVIDEQRVLTMPPVLALLRRRGNAVLSSTEAERLKFLLPTNEATKKNDP